MTKALLKLYKAISGEDSPNNRPTEIVSDIADAFEGGGGGGNVGTILQWEGTVEEDAAVIDGPDPEFIKKWFDSENPDRRGIWMLACEYNGEITPISYTDELSGVFEFADASASIEIVADPEIGELSILMSGKDNEDNPIQVRLYSIL